MMKLKYIYRHKQESEVSGNFSLCFFLLTHLMSRRETRATMYRNPKKWNVDEYVPVTSFRAPVETLVNISV